MMNYEKDIVIDSEALDIEWLEQAALFMRYAKHSAGARKTLDEAKQALDIVKAETDSDVRKTPEKYGLEKITDKAIDAVILTNTACIKANQQYLDAKFEADMASAAVQAFNMRKDALENLVKLHGMQYFAGPKVPHDLVELKKQKEKKTEAGISRTLTRGK